MALPVKGGEDHLVTTDPHEGRPVSPVGAARRKGRKAVDEYLPGIYIPPTDKLRIPLDLVRNIGQDSFFDGASKPAANDPVASGARRVTVIEAQHVISRLEGNGSVQTSCGGEQRNIRDELGAEDADGGALSRLFARGPHSTWDL